MLVKRVWRQFVFPTILTIGQLASDSIRFSANSTHRWRTGIQTRRKETKSNQVFEFLHYLIDRSSLRLKTRRLLPKPRKATESKFDSLNFCVRSWPDRSRIRGARYYRIDTREAGERGIGRGKKRATLKKLRRETPDGIGAVWNIGKRRNVREIGEGGERRRHSASRPLFMTRT